MQDYLIVEEFHIENHFTFDSKNDSVIVSVKNVIWT